MTFQAAERCLPLRFRRRTACAALILIIAALSGCDVLLSADTRVERARSHLSEGEYRAAMTELKSALQKQPDHAEARLLLAELSMWLGDLETAAKELERAETAGAPRARTAEVRYELLIAQRRFDELIARIAGDEETPPVRRLVLTAQAESGRGNYEAAQKLVEQARVMAPQDASVQLEWARVRAAQNDMAPALELPERIADSEQAPRAHWLRGQALMRQGDYDGARAAFTQAQAGRRHLRAREQVALAAALTEVNLALNDAAAAQKSLETLASWAPESVVTRHLRARIALQQNDPVRAAAEAQRALRADPEYLPAQVLLAAAHLSQGSLEQAEDVLNRLLAGHPDNPAGRKLLAQVYLARNEPQRAQQLLAQHGELATDPDAEWLLGAALLRGGELKTGVQHLERSAAAAPADARKRIDLAAAYLAAGAPAKARELLEGVSEAGELGARAQSLLVLASVAGKPRAEAQREIRQLAAEQADDSSLLSAAGAYLAMTGDAAGGRALLEQAVKLDARSADARLALAKLEARSGRMPEARRQLELVLEQAPQHEQARIALAEVAWTAGDRALARRWLEEAISATPGAVDARLRLAQLAFLEADPVRGRSLLRQAQTIARDRATVLTASARVLAQAGFADEALETFRAAAAAGSGGAALEAARLHLDLDQRGEARRLIESALAQRPQWLEAQRFMVALDARDGRVKEALARARALAGEGASVAATRALEGDVYALAGDRPAAIAAFEEAQRIQPEGSHAIKLFTLRRLAGSEDPERSLLSWLARTPEDAEARRVLALHYESSGRPQLALPHYERLLAAGAADPMMLNNLAWTLHQRGDARAVELAKRAYESAPHLAEIADTYGWILVQMGKVAEGLDVLENALGASPANPDIRYHAAVAYARSGRAPQAIDILEDVLKSHGQFFSRADAEQLLRSLTAATM